MTCFQDYSNVQYTDEILYSGTQNDTGSCKVSFQEKMCIRKSYTHHCLITEPGTDRVSQEEVMKMIEYVEAPEYISEYQDMNRQISNKDYFRPHPKHGRQHTPVCKAVLSE